MKNRKGIFVSGIVSFALIWATNASAIPFFDIYTDNGLTGQISFFDGTLGDITASDVKSFTWDTTVLGDLTPQDPNSWTVGALGGTLFSPTEAIIHSFNINTASKDLLILIGAKTTDASGSFHLFGSYTGTSNVWIEAGHSSIPASSDLNVISVPAPGVLGVMSIGLVGVGVGSATRRWKKLT